MNKTGMKKLKRKRELLKRVRCHGNKDSCSSIHKIKSTIPVLVKQKTYWYRKILIKIRELIKKYGKI